MNHEIYSAIDANINRGTEGIRVCEDIFRFSLKNKISSEFKNLRHEIAGTISTIPAGTLLCSRDILKDEQKFVSTLSEMKRESIMDLFRSNIRRAIEAARVIEEYSKNIDHNMSSSFQKIRFSLYELEKRGWLLLEKNKIMERFRNSLYAIIDTGFIKTDMMEETARILAGSGADIIQLRMKDVTDREFLSAAEKISGICRKNGVIFIVNDRPDIALICGADGIHVGQDDIPYDRIISMTGHNLITGVSVQCADEAAAASDADYIAAGPVFTTASKTDRDGSMLPVTGIEEVKKICSMTDKPVVAIGGINLSNAAVLLEVGVSSLAVISALYTGGDIQSNTKNLLGIIKSCGRSL